MNLNKKKYFLNSNDSGFTIMETLIVFSVMAVLSIIAIPSYWFFIKKTDIGLGSTIVVNTLKLAQKKTLSSETLSQWGVYFSTSTVPDQITLYKGSSYATREINKDEVFKMPDTLEFGNINLNGGSEIAYNKILGTANFSGSTTLVMISNPTQKAIVYMDASGLVGTSPFPPSNDVGRENDSRHVHFTYSGVISTSTENLELSFDGGSVIESIVIDDNIVDNQIYWEGNINVGGDTQSLFIKTIRLNDPDTLFCIFRDMGKNNKSLNIELSSGQDLILYDNAGATNMGASFFVSIPIWQ